MKNYKAIELFGENYLSIETWRVYNNYFHEHITKAKNLGMVLNYEQFINHTLQLGYTVTLKIALQM